MDYNDLKRTVEKSREVVTNKQKEMYRYARNKGFTSAESNFLKNKTTDEIDALAKDRDEQGGA